MRNKRYLTVGELRALLQTNIETCDISDDAPVVVPGFDHSLELISEPCIEEAEGSIENGLYEPGTPGAKKIKVLVIGR